MNKMAVTSVAAMAAVTTFAGFAGKDPRYPGFAEQNFKLPMRVMIIGAHPDDADYECGATAIKLSRAGARVVFVSLCNGNKGHQTMNSDALAARRYKETQAAAKEYGIEKYIVGDSPDCLIEPTLELRAKVTKMIREFAPHMVVTHRATDYHADHRATGTAVLDAIYMLGVPLYCPETPVPETLPFVMYAGDGFTLPRPLRADLLVRGDDVLEQELKGLRCHESQLFEWLPPEYGIDPKTIPTDAEGRLNYLKANIPGDLKLNGNLHANAIEKAFGEKVWYVDAYELSEYGRKPCRAEKEFLSSLGFKWTGVLAD